MSDSNDFSNDAPKAPELPRDVQQRLFIEFDGKTQLRYPGGEAFAKLCESSAIVDDFVEVRNPLDRLARVSMYQGHEPRFQVRCERLLIPTEHRCSDKLMTRILSQPMRCIRHGYLFVYCELGPGETMKIPPAWLNAWRNVKDGTVQSGQFTQVEVVGEETPPAIHSALREVVSVRTLPQGARRRTP